MRSVVRKMGNSSGIIIPKPILAEIGTKAGDDVDVLVEGGRIVIELVRSYPRAGWADAAKGLAEAGEDGLIWPEFHNDDDKNLEW